MVKVTFHFLQCVDHRCDLHLLMYVDVRILCVVTLPCRHGVSSILFWPLFPDMIGYPTCRKHCHPIWTRWRHWPKYSSNILALLTQALQLLSDICHTLFNILFFFLFFFDGNNINFSITSQLCAWCETIHVCTLFIPKSSWLCRLTWYLLHLYWYCTYINCGDREMCRFGA